MCALKATSEFFLGHAIFVIAQSLKLFFGLFVENFCRPTTSGLVFSVLSRLKTINYIVNGGSFLSLANKMVNSELFFPNVYIFQRQEYHRIRRDFNFQIKKKLNSSF